MIKESDPKTQESEFDLKAVFSLIIHGWRVIVLCVGLALMSGIIFLKSESPTYEIMALVAPTQNASSGAGNITGTEQGLLRQVLGGTNSSQLSNEVFAVLTSRVMAQRLIDHYGILQQVYANEWDATNKVWIAPSGLSALLKRAVYSFFGRKAWHPPDSQDLSNFLQSNVKIVPSDYIPIYKVTLRATDPSIGVLLLTMALSEADNYLREHSSAQMDIQLKALEQRLAASTQADTRSVLTQLMYQTMTKSITTLPELPYGLEVIDPPVLPDGPSSPSLKMGFELSLVGGLFIGMLLTLVINPAMTGEYFLATLFTMIITSYHQARDSYKYFLNPPVTAPNHSKTNVAQLVRAGAHAAKRLLSGWRL